MPGLPTAQRIYVDQPMRSMTWLRKHARMTIQTGGDLKRIRTRVLSKYCFACRTPWALTVERRDGAWVVFCKDCGTVRRSLARG